MHLNIFAYGSNMLRRRICARAPSATPIATGYVLHRRLAFHKRGRDGSAKADALFTGHETDRVWGVIYSLHRHDRCTLDRYEIGYSRDAVDVVCSSGVIAASVYEACVEMTDATLKPFCWYHGFVVEGAKEHGLPADYQRQLAKVETLADHNHQRAKLNQKLLEGPPGPRPG